MNERSDRHNIHALRNIEVLKGTVQTLLILHDPSFSTPLELDQGDRHDQNDNLQNQNISTAEDNSKEATSYKKKNQDSVISNLPGDDVIIGDKDSDSQVG